MTDADNEKERWGLHSLGRGGTDVIVQLHERVSGSEAWELQVEAGGTCVAFPVDGPKMAVRIGHFIAENLGRTSWGQNEDGTQRIYSMVAELLVLDHEDLEVAICKDGESKDGFVFRMVTPKGKLHIDLHEPEIGKLKTAFLDLEEDLEQ